MGSLIATNLMLVMFIFLCANSNASEESERKICEFCTHTPGFPSKREGAQRGITIGICKDDEAPQNQKCSKKSDQCVIMKLKRACSTSTQATLEKYFPKDAEGAELKGCWKSDQTDEVKSMMESCGGELEFIQICNENVCNKEIPKDVASTGMTVGIVVGVLVLFGVIALLVLRKKNLLCFKK